MCGWPASLQSPATPEEVDGIRRLGGQQESVRHERDNDNCELKITQLYHEVRARVRTATSVFSFRTSFVMGLVSWVLRTLIINDREMDQRSTHMSVSTHAHMRRLAGLTRRLRGESKAAHFSQSSMADRSYTWPSAVDTGSVITSSVIEHIDLHGTFPWELHGAAHTQMRADENRCSEMSGRPRTGAYQSGGSASNDTGSSTAAFSARSCSSQRMHLHA